MNHNCELVYRYVIKSTTNAIACDTRVRSHRRMNVRNQRMKNFSYSVTNCRPKPLTLGSPNRVSFFFSANSRGPRWKIVKMGDLVGTDYAHIRAKESTWPTLERVNHRESATESSALGENYGRGEKCKNTSQMVDRHTKNPVECPQLVRHGKNMRGCRLKATHARPLVFFYGYSRLYKYNFGEC